MMNDEKIEKLIHQKISIRHERTRKRLCDLAITVQKRFVIIDVERDRNGNSKTYYQDITNEVIRLYEQMRKDK